MIWQPGFPARDLVVVQDGKPRALDGEHPDQILEPDLDSLLAMFATLSATETRGGRIGKCNDTRA